MEAFKTCINLLHPPPPSRPPSQVGAVRVQREAGTRHMASQHPAQEVNTCKHYHPPLHPNPRQVSVTPNTLLPL